MTKERLVFYYLTEDLNNKKERNEIEYLARVGRVVLVSRGLSKGTIQNVKQLILEPQRAWVAQVYVVWSKLCYLLCRIANSASDMDFPLRNIYSGGRLLRAVTNALWQFKRLTWVNRLLPTYDRIYFAPIRLAHVLFCMRRMRRVAGVKRVVVHDSLILRLGKFAPFIVCARRSGVQTIANVKSWDNPFYSQFASSANGFFVWSSSMWADIQRVHGLPDRPVHVWGARPFFNFSHAVTKAAVKLRSFGDSLTVGYAAAFCDSIMAQHEVAVLCKIATELEKSLPQARILVRPYPTLPLSKYGEFGNNHNIELVGIKGELIDRYSDGREFIRFGSDDERAEYLSRCDCFLSMATSFTIEAAISGLPIVHFFVKPDECSTGNEFTFFQRIDISDHLDVYFNQELLVARSYRELISCIRSMKSEASRLHCRARAMLTRIGIPENTACWESSSNSLVADIKSTVTH